MYNNFFALVIFLSYLFFVVSCSVIPNNSVEVSNAARINVKLAFLYLEQGEIKIAKKKLLRAYKDSPNDPIVNDALGNFYGNVGELNIAQNYYIKAIKFASEKGYFWHSYGRFLYKNGDYNNALKYLLLAARDLNYISTGKAYADVSKVAWRLQQTELAKKYYKAAIAHGFKI